MQLRPYQSSHSQFLIEALKTRRTAHDGSDTGTGKTYCAAHIASTLCAETLVVCPLSVVPVWSRVLADAGVTASVINYESAWRKFGALKPWGSGSFFQWSKPWPLVIFDEAHRAGGETTNNSKMLIAAKRQCGMVLTLSATAADSLLKLKALGFALGLHQLSDYRQWLLSNGATEQLIYGRGGKPVMQKNGMPARKIEIGKRANAEAMSRLHEQIYGTGRRGSRMRIADIPDFPRTQIELRLLEGCPASVAKLSTELQGFYRQKNVMGALSQDELAKLVFYRQAAEIAKLDCLMDMAEDALETSKVAIFVNFNRTVDELSAACDKRGWRCATIRGEQKLDDRQAVIDLFQANRLDVVICNIQAGGVGVSLHDEKTQYPRTALICPGFDAVQVKQALGRVHRNSGGVSRQFLIYWGTGVEARVAKSVERKLDNLALLNDDEVSGIIPDETPVLSIV